MDVSGLVLNPNERMTAWTQLNSGGGEVAPCVGLSIEFSEDEITPMPMGSNDLENQLVKTLPPHLSKFVPPKFNSIRSSSNSRTGGNVIRGMLHLTLYKYLSARRASALKPRSPYIACKVEEFSKTGLIEDNDSNVNICKPVFSSASGSEELNLHFDSSQLLMPVVNRSAVAIHIVVIELRDGDESHYRVLANTTIPIFDKILRNGHVMKMFLPLRMANGGNVVGGGVGEKAGYLQFGAQFLPGNVTVGKKVKKSRAAKSTTTSPSRVTAPSPTPSCSTPGGDNSTYAQPLLCIQVESARNLRCPGWPGRKEPFVEACLLKPSNLRGGNGVGGKVTALTAQQTDIAISDGNEGLTATFLQTLKFSFPPEFLNVEQDPSFELTSAKVILLLKIKGSARRSGEDGGGAATIGECKIPIPWSVMLRGKKQRRWHSLRKCQDQVSSHR